MAALLQVKTLRYCTSGFFVFPRHCRRLGHSGNGDAAFAATADYGYSWFIQKDIYGKYCKILVGE